MHGEVLGVLELLQVLGLVMMSRGVAAEVVLLLSLRARISSVRSWVREGGSVLSQPNLWIQRPHEGRDGAGGQMMALT